MNQGDDGTTNPGGSPKPGDGARIPRIPPATIELTATPIPDPVEPDAAAGHSASASGDTMASSGSPRASSGPNGSGSSRLAASRFAWKLALAGLVTTVIVAGVVGWRGSEALRRAETTALEKRLGAAEAQLGEIASRPQAASVDPKEIAAFGARLASFQAQVEAQLRDLAARPMPPAGADPAQVAALAGRLDEIGKRLQTMEQALNRMDAVTKRVDALDQSGHRMDVLAAQIVKIEAALAAPRPAVVDPALVARVAALDTGAKALTDRLGEIEKRLDQVATTARDATRRAEAAGEAAAKPPTPTATDQAVRFAVLAAALRSAVERGDPFAAELAAVKPFAPDAAALAPLAPFAAGGVPSPATLARELSAILPALIAAQTPAEVDGSLIDRLKASTSHLVRIRRVGETPGDDPGTVLARIEAEAAHRDVAGALADLAKLPPAARAPAEAWIKSATGRSAALDAARRLAAGALATLAASPQ